MTPDEGRRERMRQFVGSMKWCRPARENEAAGRIRYVDLAGIDSRDGIRSACDDEIGQFILGEEAAMVIHTPSDPQSEDLDAARDRAILMLEESLCLAYEHMVWTKTRDEIREAIRRHIVLPTAEHRGKFDRDGTDFIHIGMAPQYPEGHPRRAPELLVVLTWRMQARAYVQQHLDYATKLRETSNKTHGSPYNGNHFWLDADPPRMVRV